MVRLTQGKKSRKRQSEFQRLWAKAERLRKENARFHERLDKIIRRMETEIRPIEMQAARKQIPLLRNLLMLGQRKTLAKWQRHELHDWIQELLEPLVVSNAINAELYEDIARYDAFRLGVELDDSSATPLAEQLKEELEAEEAISERNKEELHKEIQDEVERILDDTFGPEPPKPEKNAEEGSDLFQDELSEELERQYNDYHKRRNKAREELLAEMLSNDGFPFDDADEDEEDDFFNFDDFDPFGSDSTSTGEPDRATPVISNEVFKRLFRSTAGQLHPDRESDPILRDEKHALMSQLLEARKHGDVMTIVEMYQKYVADDASLSKSDERELITTLKQQIDELACEKEEYSFQSPLHRIAFETFYFPSQRKTDQAFKQHIQRMKQTVSEVESQALNIRTLKTLKPYLEERYEEHRFFDPFEAFDEMFGSRR